MKPYSQIPFLPNLIAEAVCSQEYTGQDVSLQIRSQAHVDKTEAKRKLMTLQEIQAFAEKCDERCRGAYEAKAEWFLKCVRSKTNTGRDQMYIWIAHWLSAYLNDPAGFLAKP